MTDTRKTTDIRMIMRQARGTKEHETCMAHSWQRLDRHNEYDDRFM